MRLYEALDVARCEGMERVWGKWGKWDEPYGETKSENKTFQK